MMSNFLSLVNMVILESKIALDALTSNNFANPPRTVMYDRFKEWVARAYQELMNERPEWFFTRERAVLTIGPRLHLAGITGWTPAIGDFLTGVVSNKEFVITELFPGVEGQDVADEITVGVEFSDDNQFVLNELLTVTQGINVFTEAAYVAGRGVYNWEQLLPTLDIMDVKTVSVQPTARGAFPNTNPSALWGVSPLMWQNYSHWTYPLNDFSASDGQPRYITQLADGNYDFWPRADGEYDVAFAYSQKANELLVWNDEPLLLAPKYHMYLVWKALVSLADFNKDPVLFSRANKEATRYFNWILRDYIPKITVNVYRFDGLGY